MNITEKLHSAALRIIDREKEYSEKLFQDCRQECEGMSTEEQNALYIKKYAHWVNRATERIDDACRVFFYTSSDVPRITKQINHRATVAEMRKQKRHRMQLSTLPQLPPWGQY